MTTHHETTTTTTSNTTGSGLFNNHGAGFPQDTATNNTHLGATSGRDTNNTHLGASTAREADTLSAGSTANGSFSRMANHNNELEKDFSRQDGKLENSVLLPVTDFDRLWSTSRPQHGLGYRSETDPYSRQHLNFSGTFREAVLVTPK